MDKEQDKTRQAKSITALWSPLTEDQRQLLVENLSTCKLKAGEELFGEGHPPRNLYYLHSGKVVMQSQGVSSQQIVRMVEPGAIFGYAAAFEGSSYPFSARVGIASEVYVVPISLIFHLIWENSDFAMLFLKELSELLGLSVKRTISLTQKHIRGRLSESLLIMKEKYGVEDDGQTIAVYLSRDDMAKMSNMTTSNAIRTLSAFASEGIVAIEGRKLKILDEKALRRISQLG